ncbi:hypothetical protein DSO57_1010270 [Entomophthora muscae]|uniref:Uncharacterized protein n=1 Tax=Entomophthora muscae TaxID=34485 RepID=A0ACC2SJY0_9FUNG|nr:hypothetical protein DSO57_1010270 [Entomophthora muscae]
MKFHIAALISLVTAQAAGLSFGKPSVKADSQPSAQSSQKIVPIVKRGNTVGHYLKEATQATGKIVKDAGKAIAKPFKEPSKTEKFINAVTKPFKEPTKTEIFQKALNKAGDKVFDAVYDGAASANRAAKKAANTAMQAASKSSKKSDKYDQFRAKYSR